MYRPNFCAECGNHVERARWRWWTSGRFCAACDGRFKRRRAVAAVFGSLALLGAGFVAGRAGRPVAPPLVIERGTPFYAPAANPLSAPASLATAEQPTRANAPGGARYGADGSPDERPTDPSETISMCGARTKKGTPCSRRVRGTGRCWQHVGRSAILPASKLIIQGKGRMMRVDYRCELRCSKLARADGSGECDDKLFRMHARKLSGRALLRQVRPRVS